MNDGSDSKISTQQNVSKPTHCPRWCDTWPHLDEDTGLCADGTIMHSHNNGPGQHLDTHSNSVTGRVVRQGGGYWDVSLTQVTGPQGQEAETVQLMAEKYDTEGQDRSFTTVVLPLTTGEARSVAAALIRLADIGELS